MTDDMIETTSLLLASLLLAFIPQAGLNEIASEPTVDGRRIFRISLPPHMKVVASDIASQFHQRWIKLVAELETGCVETSFYDANRKLNLLRDELLEIDHTIRARQQPVRQ